MEINNSNNNIRNRNNTKMLEDKIETISKKRIKLIKLYTRRKVLRKSEN